MKAFNEIYKNIQKYDAFNSDLSFENFEKDEKSYITDALKEFDSQIRSMKEALLNFTKKDTDYNKCNNIMNQIIKELNYILNKEFKLSKIYFSNIHEIVTGKNLLIYFQYKIIKLKEIVDFLKELL